jgi:hypothetical protein
VGSLYQIATKSARDHGRPAGSPENERQQRKTSCLRKKGSSPILAIQPVDVGG